LQAVLRQIWDEVVEHAALSEQGMGALFGGIGLEMPIYNEAFTGGAQQGQQTTAKALRK
jgi:hypothetical protein